MPYNVVSWVYKDPLTIQKLSQGEENNVWTNEHGRFGCQMDITGTSIVQIYDGRISLNGNWLVENSSALTRLIASTTAHWEENTALEGASATSFHVVAFASANGFNVKFRSSAPAYSDTSSGTSTGPKIYDKTGSTWFRYIARIVNNTASEIDITQSHLIF